MKMMHKTSFPVQVKGGNTPKVPKPPITPPPQKKPETGKAVPTKKIKPKAEVATITKEK